MMERSQRAGGSVHEIISEYSAMVYRLAYARCASHADAQDVYQEVFFRFFRTKPGIESDEHLKAWLIRATIHTSTNLLRSAWRRYIRPMPEGYDAPAVQAREDERLENLRSALRRLPVRLTTGMASMCIWFPILAIPFRNRSRPSPSCRV